MTGKRKSTHYGHGTIARSPNGRWDASIYLPDGRRRARLRTLGEAKAWLDAQDPGDAIALIGLDDATLAHEGRPPEKALADFLAFIGKHLLIGYNIAFDLTFLRAACARHGLPAPANPARDLLPLARRKCPTLPNHRLETLARHLALPVDTLHRALPDALLTHRLYAKLQTQ